MNYLEWSNEYYTVAESISTIIENLKLSRATANVIDKKAINLKIAKYKICYNELIDTANLLRDRHRGVR